MKQRQRRLPANRSDVDAWLKQHGGDRVRCRKAAYFVGRIGGVFNDLGGLRELRAALFSDDESAGCLDRRIQELEAERCQSAS